MSLSHRFLKATRSTHLYLGVFFAPALLFFAFTGGLQSFSLHEATRGSSYTPPAWLATMAQLHKKQTTVKPAKKRPATIDAGASSTAQMSAPVAAKPQKNLLPMKIFFALVALSLFLSTLSGLYMACRYSRNARRISLIFAAGVIVPLCLWWF